MDQSTPTGPAIPDDAPRTPREEALERALQEADRRKDELLAALSHELRNPMSALAASIHLLRQDRLAPENRARALDIMQRQIFAMSSMVDDLLELSRLRRGKIVLQRQVLDVVSHLVSAVEDHRSGLNAKGLGLDVDVPEAPLWVDGDPTRLSQAIAHLLRYCVLHAPSGSRVGVRLAESEGAAELTVTRAGPGLESEAPDFFEPYGQLVIASGTGGLGLTLVRGIVELHGGSVKGENLSPGGGVRLGLRLPLAPEPRPTEEEGDRSPSLDVLIIEDNADAADALAMLLSLVGHRPRITAEGQAGLDAARLRRPDVVLCDIRLPGALDGYDVARALRQDPGGADLFLVALTGYGQDVDRQRSRGAGFDLHLTKPVQPDELVRILRERRPAAG